MINLKLARIILLYIILFTIVNKGIACSSYKITIADKTMAGSNYDAYYLSLKIWFETKSATNTYGAAYTGGRFDGKNGYAPQSGMNEFGLTFSRLSSAAPEKPLKKFNNKKVITNPTVYLKDILHKCKTIEEVKNYISEYDYSYFINDVFIYIEKSGKYLIVEPDTMTVGSNEKYVLGNFCPTQTTNEMKLEQAKYKKGVLFIKNKLDTSIKFCTALSDTMHVCRKKIGDGTLLTIIRDLKEGIIYLNFYHDYNHQVKFDLQKELAKGDHSIDIPSLFPLNKEYERLCSYKTPQNNKTISTLLFIFSGLFFFSSIFFLISYFNKKSTKHFSKIKLLIAVISFCLLYYTLILLKTEYIFYFPAPYKDYKFSLLNIAAYIPFFMLIAIIPLVVINYKIFKNKYWSMLSKWLFAINNSAYLTLIILYMYWGLFNVFN